MFSYNTIVSVAAELNLKNLFYHFLFGSLTLTTISPLVFKDYYGYATVMFNFQEILNKIKQNSTCN